jgi:hypothetical protein
LLLGALAWDASVAHAEDTKRALVICGKCVLDADVAVERELHRALGELKRFELLPAVKVDFEAVQIELDCAEESAQCLHAAALKLKADALFIPTLARQAGSSSLRVVYFDAASGEAPRSVTRSRSGAGSARSWRSELAAILHELLDEPKPQVLVVAAKPAAEADAAAAEAEPAGAQPEAAPAASAEAEPSKAPKASSPGLFDALPLGPLVLGAAGLAVVATGLAVGAMASATESDYEARVVNSPKQAELAEQDRKRGKREVLIANVLLGTGAAAIAGAAVWFVLDRTHADRPTETALSPRLGPDAVGLVLAGSWEAGP